MTCTGTPAGLSRGIHEANDLVAGRSHLQLHQHRCRGIHEANDLVAGRRTGRTFRAPSRGIHEANDLVAVPPVEVLDADSQSRHPRSQ